MKTFPFLVVVVGCLLAGGMFVPVAAVAQSAAATGSPAARPTATEAAGQQVRAFYKWYMHAINKNQQPLEGKYRKELKRYVTPRLLKEIDRVAKGPDGLDGDYFIDAQDWDKEWEQHIELKNVQASGVKGNAEVTLSGPNMNRRLRLQLVLEDKLWKVDKVAGVD